MTGIVVNGATPFGALSNKIAQNMIQMQADVPRLEAALAAAASAFSGAAGTEFETGTNFGVVPDTAPGEQGTNWRSAVDNLSANWATFWAANKGFITALDNG